MHLARYKNWLHMSRVIACLDGFMLQRPAHWQ
jgi:hypothetical protein